MNLHMNPADDAFRAEVKQFLAEKVSDDIQEAGRYTAGVVSEIGPTLRWQKLLGEKGWIAGPWPKEFGGAGWSITERYIFDSACAEAGTPRPYAMGVRMVGPVIMKFGTQEQKDYYLPRILRSDDIWCQGYSEPGSGSDLASLQTRAVSDGDDYVINGTKIWTTGAHVANRIFCLVRTSTEGKPQEGISFILIDMDTPGITVQPILSISGDHELNQVFFDNVRVPKKNRVGEENKGWTVAKYLLEFERGGGAYTPGLHVALDRLEGIAKTERHDGDRLFDDADFRKRTADLRIAVTAAEYTEKRVMSALSLGQNPGTASSTFKLRGSEVMQKISELALEAVAYYGTPFQPETRIVGNNATPIGPDYAVSLQPRYLNQRAATIYAGSSEVQRSIIAKFVLGL